MFYTHHQTAPFPGAGFISPPFADPISREHASADALRWLNPLNRHDHRVISPMKHGMPGSDASRKRSTCGIRAYLDNVGNFRHTACRFFTETALYRYATPHFYTVDADSPRRRQPLAKRRRCSIRAPGKADGGALADACRYMYGASMAVLDMAVEYREQMVYNKYKAARDTIERFEKDPPYAYIMSTSANSTILRKPGGAATREADAARHRSEAIG